MNQTPEAGPKGENFTCAHAGALKDLGRFSVPHPLLPREIEGKLFLKEALGLTGLEVSLNRLPPRAFVPFAHRFLAAFEIAASSRSRQDGQLERPSKV